MQHTLESKIHADPNRIPEMKIVKIATGSVSSGIYEQCKDQGNTS